jgi:alkane 1-monooxygenase
MVCYHASALQSIVGIFLLETLNYVGHYGLIRRQVVPGRYEPVPQWHSWDSSHRFGNWLPFNGGRHSDRHCDPSRSYLSLSTRATPQLPGGYFAMFVLALFPPLWRRIMDPRVPMLLPASAPNVAI